MRFKTFFISLILSLYTNISYACDYKLGDITLNDSKYDCINIVGKLNITNSIIGTVYLTGKLEALNVTINILNVTGKVQASNLNLNNLDSTGTFELNGTSNHITGISNIVGTLAVSNTLFDNVITITSSLVKFKNSTTRDLYFKKNSDSKDEEEYLYVDNSVINGNITFENKKGKIILSNGGKINGIVDGGIIINN